MPEMCRGSMVGFTKVRVETFTESAARILHWRLKFDQRETFTDPAFVYDL